MRHRIRIQPYLSPETHRKMRAYAMGNGVTDSAVAEAALAEYLSRDSLDEALVVRRLDGLARAVQQLQRDVDVLSQAFGIFARRSFMAPAPVPVAEDQERADGLYRAFVARVSADLDRGMRFAGDVARARRKLSPPAPGTGSGHGR
ncbi:MAG: hypothetical protein ABJA82_08750 [Myxococcales bacterium]